MAQPKQVKLSDYYVKKNGNTANKNIVTDQNGSVIFEDYYTKTQIDTLFSNKENINNKSSNITTDTGSTTKYPTVKAVEDYAQQKGNYPVVSDLKTVAFSGNYNDLTNKPDAGFTVRYIGNYTVEKLIDDYGDQNGNSFRNLLNDLEITPTQGIIYLLPYEDEENHNEYIYVHDEISNTVIMELLGTTATNVDLSDYLTTSIAALTYQPKDNYLTERDVGNSSDTSSSKIVACNDTRLSDARTPTSHTHGNISNTGTMSGKSQNVVTDSNGVITTEAKPTIPTKTSDLTNDSGFLTEHQNLDDFLLANGNTIAQSSFISKGSTENIQLANGSTTPQSTFATSGHNHDGTYLKNPNVFYGTCSTSAATQNKVVSVSNWSWTTGNILFVKFSNNNTYNGTARISIDSTVKDIATIGTTKTSRYYWKAGELVCFVYDGTNMLMLEQGIADTTDYYGVTRFSDIVNLIYPVGSIYMSVNSTSPATLFGGTWTKIEGAFLLASGRVPIGTDTYIDFANGDTGGEAIHTLSVDEMPSHTHIQDPHNHSQNAHSHRLNNSAIIYNGSASGQLPNGNAKKYTTNSGNNVGTDNATASNQPQTATNQNTGGSKPHNNMPPYLAVNVWKRTA